MSIPCWIWRSDELPRQTVHCKASIVCIRMQFLIHEAERRQYVRTYRCNWRWIDRAGMVDGICPGGILGEVIRCPERNLGWGCRNDPRIAPRPGEGRASKRSRKDSRMHSDRA